MAERTSTIGGRHSIPAERTFTAGFLFCGLGAGARGFLQATATVGCWHRPLTTLELAALQGLPVHLDGAPLALAGRSVATWRERIGNAVPVQAGTAIAGSLLLALLSAALGTWTLGSTGIWVRPEERSAA